MLVKNLKKKLDKNENLILSKDFYELAHFFLSRKASKIKLPPPTVFTWNQCKRVAEDLEIIICAPRLVRILGENVLKPEMCKAIQIFRDELQEILDFCAKAYMNTNIILTME